MRNDHEKIVYFAGAIRGDRLPAVVVIREIVRYIKELGFPVLTEHVGADDPIAEFARKIGKTKETLTVEDIEKRDITWLDQATHVVAEISGASTGTGREIEYARTKGKLGKTPAKILCLYQIEREFFASPMIRGMDAERYPEIVVKAYRDIDEAKKMVVEFLEWEAPQRDLLERATDPRQYDAENFTWHVTLETPYAECFFAYLCHEGGGCKDKDVLDVGSGNGWLLDGLKKIGARSVAGVEASEKNFLLSQERYPDIPVANVCLDEYRSDRHYGFIVLMHVMQHIRDLEGAFRKLSELSTEDGSINIIVPDYDYNREPRHDYEITLEDIDDSEFVVAVKRPENGMIVDIIRRRKKYIQAAMHAGLTLLKKVPIIPTDALMQKDSKYRAYEHRPIAWLLVFQKEHAIA